MLSQAKSENLKYGNQSGIAENYIRELKNKVESQELEIMRANDGYAYFRSQRDLLHGELAERERAPRDTQLRGFHEALRRDEELRIDEVSKRKNIEYLNTIEEHTGQLQE